MASNRPWQGVRMRRVAAAADPEGPPRLVTLPSSWDDRSAEALAALAPGDGDVSVATASALWLGMLIRQARCSGEDGRIAGVLHGLLRDRRVAPNERVWRGEAELPGFVLNLAAFHEAGGAFDIAAFAAASSAIGRACRLLAPDAARYANGLAGLDDLLAALGIAYDSAGARLAAACLACLFRARIDLALEGDQRDLLALPADWPAPPLRCPIPGLAEEAAAARAQVTRSGCAKPSTGIFAAGPVEALLGIETGGIAPGFSPVRDRHLTRAAQNRLAAAALSPEAALAAVLDGDEPLPVPGLAAHQAMHEAVAPYLHSMQALPAALPSPPAAVPRHQPRTPQSLPVRHSGLTQKITIGGHRLFLRTSEYADGRLGEITLSMPRESAAFRATLEAFAQAVSIGLQHGVTLESFVDAFALLSFAPAGVVEGDPAIGEASSVIDYVVRTLAKNYLGRTLAKPEFSEIDTDAETLLLPMNLPRGPSPRALRKTLRIVA